MIIEKRLSLGNKIFGQKPERRFVNNFGIRCNYVVNCSAKTPGNGNLVGKQAENMKMFDKYSNKENVTESVFDFKEDVLKKNNVK